MMALGRTAQRLFLAAAASGCLLSLAGCSRLHARTTPDVPPLEMPPPPPRLVEPADVEPPPPVALPEEPARNPAATNRRPAPSQPRPEPPKQEPPKVDQTVPPVAAEPPKAAEDVPKPATTLQTIPPGAEGEMERTIRAQLSHAANDLTRVDYRALNSDARTQYDTAKGLVRQAEDALKARNLVFAKSIADKAAALAAQLASK